MATVNKFEDLEVWQMARKYAGSIHTLKLKENFSKEYKFKDQIKDSSGSVMDNIAEVLVEKAGWNLLIFWVSQKVLYMNPNRSYTELLIMGLYQKKYWI